ncbi:MAG: FAD-dependent oxidoreductase, partial [Betaproteobacteria bacterium]|nr:FAD-dependent oxidoreductase [Betaproteobacteria bacterium]
MNNGVFDVVVVGGGGSGLAVALTAADAGLRVALIEKNPKLGGTTALSIGSITAAGTALQRSTGIADSADAHFADFDLFPVPEGAVDNLLLRRLYVDHAADTLHWLMSLGIVFHGPSPEAPHTRPRMHNVLPHSGATIHCLASACRARGVDIRVATTARGLVEEAGRVAGVEVDSPRGRTLMRARKGVVLTTGDYSAGTGLLRELAGERYAAIGALNTTSTG